MTALVARPTEALSGRAILPGDKSISHRALMLAGLAVGETRIAGLLEAEDVASTAGAMTALGAEIERDSHGIWHVWGRGIGGLVAPQDVLDLGNSGTGARLLMGLLASHPLGAVVTGDASLRRRPMTRVAQPLRQIGARISLRAGGRLPAVVEGSDRPLPLRYRLPVPSAQVKSAILLAGLAAPGRTTVVEREASRDHTEIMLRHFGAQVETTEEGDEGLAVTVTGQPELSGCEIHVPRDPSSAAFALVAAAVLPGSRVQLPGVGINPRRSGLLQCLEDMGAHLRLENRRQEGGEAVADLTVEGAALHGIDVPAAVAPTMIDEYPILAVAAALAKGRTVMRGLGELRVKESDRLAAVAGGLAACGVEVEAGEDSLTVTGSGARPPGGAVVQAVFDHRIAMSFLVLGLAAERPVTIDDAAPIATSFPGFLDLMTGLGARMEAA